MSGARGKDAFFLNLKLRQRDKAHGVGRLLSRAWASDPFLRSTMDRLVLGEGAIAQKIRFSPVFRNRFNKYIKELTNNQKNRVKDLASAKHRFCSHSAPLGRSALYIVPLILTAQDIIDSRGRRSPEGQAAYSWLADLSEDTTTNYVVLITDHTKQVFCSHKRCLS